MFLWHYRLGHCDMRKVEYMSVNKIVEGMEKSTVNVKSNNI